eukprot:2954765-Rhodomonas_salina.12
MAVMCVPCPAGTGHAVLVCYAMVGTDLGRVQRCYFQVCRDTMPPTMVSSFEYYFPVQNSAICLRAQSAMPGTTVDVAWYKSAMSSANIGVEVTLSCDKWYEHMRCRTMCDAQY